MDSGSESETQISSSSSRWSTVFSDIDIDKNFLAVPIKHEHLERYKLNYTEAGEFSVLGNIWKGNIE